MALLYDIQTLGRPIRSLKMVMNRVPMLYEFIPAIMFLLALLMVSEIRYSSFKGLRLLRPRSMRALVLTLLILVLIYVYPQNMIFIFYVSYIGWGLTDYFLRRPLSARARRDSVEPEYQQDHYGK